VWCQENNLTLNANKTKEMIVDFRKQQREHPPIHIDGTVVEREVRFKFLCEHITDKLNWSTHTGRVVNKAQQHLCNLRRLKKFVLSPKALTNFYRCTIESILSCCITAWYGNCSAHNRKALQRVVRSAQCITGCKLPALQDTNTTRCQRKAIKIKDNNHPSHCLFTPAIIQKARSVQVHQSRDRETEKQLLSQGHQTVKTATTNIEGLLPTY
jgi:hypothetical protein